MDFNKTTEAIIGGVADNFNNQLSVILGMADLLKEECHNNEYLQGMVDDIVLAASRSSELVKLLLTTAQQENSFQKESYSIKAIISTIKTILISTIKSRSIMIESSVSDSLLISVDKGELVYVVTYLIVKLFADSIKDITLQIFEKSGKLFWVLELSGGTETPKDLLSGDERSLLSRLLKKSDITLQTDSQERVTLEFPLVAPPPQSVVSLVGEKVLLVDDEPVALMVAKKILEHKGYKVLSAETGENAVALFETDLADVGVAIIDMKLPDMGGAELFTSLRVIEPTLKIIICSGYSLNEEIEELLNRGGALFLQKPYSSQTLYDIVEKAKKDSF